MLRYIGDIFSTQSWKYQSYIAFPDLLDNISDGSQVGLTDPWKPNPVAGRSERYPGVRRGHQGRRPLRRAQPGDWLPRYG